MTGARVRRIETDASGLATGATWIDRDGAEHFEPAKVVVVAANAIGTPRLLLLSASPRHPDGLANSSGLVGKRLMMHPFANVAGLFEEPLMSWQGQFGDLIESLEFYETDEKRGFVRGARWGLAPTGGPINTALPSRAGEQVWGPDHHPHVKTPPRPRRELGPVRRGPARRGEPHHAVVDGHRLVRDPGAGGPLPDVRQLAPDARLPHRAGEGVDGRRRRLQDRGRPADALLGLAPAGHGADGRRPDDLGPRPLEPQPTTSRTCTSSTARAS